MQAIDRARPLRVGVAGLGRLGRRHAQNLAYRVPGATLAAACSPLEADLAWAREALPAARLYGEYADLLADQAVDAVWLVTPSALHAGQIVQALEAGKHVFCEKPLSLDVAECERVVNVSRRHAGRQVTIGFMRRFDPSYQDAYAKVQAGAIGRPFLVRSQTCDLNDPEGFFVRFAPTSGGIFLDCTVHDIDVARWLLGKPRATRVYAAGAIALHEGLRESGDVDNGVAICEFEGGRLAMFYASRTMAHGNDTSSEVIGTAGALAIGRIPRANRVDVYDATGVRSVCTPTFFDRFEEAFLIEAQAFVAEVAARKAGDAQKGSLGATLEDALEATRIGQALRESLHTGAAVTL
ncbi:Gfo/Idh/MocA family oxidoreductase [Paraburkholderia silvatlantica]|uniref:Myo-inositol 2-dehydrogenase/D-chiro-inositol 1-dehydrogenase n=1 Tax=Paraburkholderia silvatlantica TaxID=321895 RepID=A0A2U0ZPH5_9BURK|nr:Gfo/Idh/MocA family oxidoreductase [Paraburkholderia silvatlantica]MBB2932347.1 myo-inositol 2-dehydrogenase/D-chiro-inositol 1-dehydrogenase [Paraburkholderia silvatlantica]PVY20804.1 myo-inositol 2-dehydrogenase/D-chiro-inositol 1-dehydrogenase [Paraburkholderia silvatlantica]PXW25832.1 myo-inositol 2-dehydrogenase/D-chiro-inositol 1-dehydrogenase [Paraburkholderia silvatlantica]PYE13827.1 myo-inositol 2-dehydrogenase/D-chiro-inositol 1-dehydrogenase [Paraburkholderia silvatlantica]